MNQEDDLPILGLPAYRMAEMAQVLNMIAQQVAMRREALGRAAWSDAEHAARLHDLQKSGPALRAMTEDERRRWSELESEAETLRSADQHVTTRTERLEEGWGVEARGLRGEDVVAEAYVVCRDEAGAQELAEWLREDGNPESVTRLAEVADAASDALRRQKEALEALDGPALIGELTERLGADLTQRLTNDEAWAACHATFAGAVRAGHDLDELADVVNRLDYSRARKPAALASWAIQRAIELGETTPAAGSDAVNVRRWIAELKEHSTVDRYVAEQLVGRYGEEIDGALAQKFPGLLSRSRADAELHGDRANLAEREAANRLSVKDDPTTVEREDIAAQDEAGVDLHDAAHERASAAEAEGNARAAEERAAVTFEPSNTARTAQRANATSRKPSRGKAPIPAPRPVRSR